MVIVSRNMGENNDKNIKELLAKLGAMSAESKEKAEHKFWQTQPVTQFGMFKFIWGK